MQPRLVFTGYCLGWVTVSVFVTAGLPETVVMVMVADRSAPDVLGDAVNVTDASPTLDCVSVVSHVTDDVTRQ